MTLCMLWVPFMSEGLIEGIGWDFVTRNLYVLIY